MQSVEGKGKEPVLCLPPSLPCSNILSPSVVICSFLSYNCLTVLCQFLLYNNVNQLYVYIYLLPPEPPSHLLLAPLQVLTEHRALQLPVSTAASHQLPVLHTVVYLCQCHSLSSSHRLLPPLYPQVHYLCLCLCSGPADRFVSTVFLGSLYVH